MTMILTGEYQNAASPPQLPVNLRPGSIARDHHSGGHDYSVF